jgi:hypothetical protein
LISLKTKPKDWSTGMVLHMWRCETKNIQNVRRQLYIGKIYFTKNIIGSFVGAAYSHFHLVMRDWIYNLKDWKLVKIFYNYNYHGKNWQLVKCDTITGRNNCWSQNLKIFQNLLEEIFNGIE